MTDQARPTISPGHNVQAIILLILCGILNGCQLPSTRPASSVPAVVPEPPPQSEPAPIIEAPSAPVAMPEPAPVDPWAALREGLQPQRCSDPPVASWIKRYAGHPDRFGARLSGYAQLLHYVSSQAVLREIPLQAALVPIVESTYSAYPAKGNRPAGMWQMVPGTARSLGLTVQGDRDDRLDTVRATEAALSLFERLLQRFDNDFHLALAAYNAGDGRVARALQGSDQRDPRKLRLSKITHDYLDKVEALSCLYADPPRYGFSMPPMPAESQLTVVTLPFRADAVLLARALNTDETTLRRNNGAIRGPRQRAAGHPWLVPQRLNAAALQVQAGQVSGLALAQRSPVVANGETPSIHIVERGDNLWSLARLYGLTVNKLRSWNGLGPRAILRIGQRIKLSP